MEIVSMNTWNRAEIFNFYQNVDYPFFSVSFKVDISKFMARLKAASLPFYHSMIFAIATSANSIEAFRYRLVGEDLIKFDIIHPSFTENADDDLFKIVRVDLGTDLRDFVGRAQAADLGQTSFLTPDGENRKDVYYMTSIPWVPFMQFTNPVSLKNDDLVPRFAWGRFTRENDALMMPVSLQLHHSITDGRHAGLFYEAFCKYLDDDAAI